jgi:hypothetical protein
VPGYAYINDKHSRDCPSLNCLHIPSLQFIHHGTSKKNHKSEIADNKRYLYYDNVKHDQMYTIVKNNYSTGDGAGSKFTLYISSNCYLFKFSCGCPLANKCYVQLYDFFTSILFFTLWKSQVTTQFCHLVTIHKTGKCITSHAANSRLKIT